MASLFELKNNIVVIEPSSLLIPEMKVIWDRDKSKGKDTAFKELSYVYYLADYKSPYQSYPDDKREEVVARDFMKNEKYKPDKEIKEAIKRYDEFQQTPSMRLLKAVNRATDEITIFLETGKSDRDITKVVNIIKETGKIVEGRDKIEDKVKKEITTSEKIRGGGVARNRER